MPRLIRYCTFFLLFAVVVSLPFLNQPSQAAPPEQEKAAVIAALQQKATEVASIRSTFTQTTHIPMFAHPMVSHGQFMFKRPNSLRWEYTTPVREGFVITTTRGFRWEEDPAKRSDFTPGSDPVATIVARNMLDWMTLDLARIERLYTLEVIAAEPVRLALYPMSKDMRQVIRRLIMTFTPEGLAASVEIQEARGGSTLIVFTDFTVNEPLDDREFQ